MANDTLCAVPTIEVFGQRIGENITIGKAEGLLSAAQMFINQISKAENLNNKIKTSKGCDFFY